MLQALLAGLFALGMLTSAVVLNEAVNPDRALQRLTPIVVGTLDLDSSPGSATFALSNMAPGDTAVRALTIANGGTLPFRYAMHSAVDEDPSGLAAQLVVAVRESVDGTCDTEDGAVIAERTVPAALAFGSAAWGQQDGDRPLAVGESEVLCFFVELPLSATNEVGGAAASISFTFDAEEVRPE